MGRDSYRDILEDAIGTLLGDGGDQRPRPDRNAFYDADLDELHHWYRENGYDPATLEDTYTLAHRHWYDAVRGTDTEDVWRSVDVPEADGTTHMLGVAHGQVFFLEPEEAVRDRLRDEVLAAAEDAPVYTEGGLATYLFGEDAAEHEHLHELPDHDLVAGTTGYTLLTTVADQYRKQDTGSNEAAPGAGIGGTLADAADELFRAYYHGVGADSDRMADDIAATMVRGVEDPDALADVQDLTRAMFLPFHLEEQYIEHVDETAPQRRRALWEDAKHAWSQETGVRRLLDTATHTVEAAVTPQLEQASTEFLDAAIIDRSRYMAEHVETALAETDGDEVYYLLGAGHPPHIADLHR